jgi:hypothetical protein
MDALQEVERKTYRYWYTDGLAEIASGIIFALLGVFFLVQSLDPHGLMALLSAVILPVVLIAGMLLMRRMISVGKERLTYPRTGYVAYRRQRKSRRWAAGVMAMFTSLLLVVFQQRVAWSMSWLLLLEGLAIGAGLAYPAYRFGLARFYALALLAILVAAGAALKVTDIELGNAFFFGAMGVGLLSSGGVTLVTYLQSTRPPEEGSDA